jgi:amino acid transporter
MADANGSKGMSVQGAIFLGIGAMVGAGIFALLGEAGAVAGTAVWVSFLIAGIVTLLQGYSFAKLGARFPSRGGTIEFLAAGFGNGHLTGIASWMIYSSVLITSAMVSVSFGSYTAALIAGDNYSDWVARVFTIGLIIAVTLINLIGSKFVDRFQTYIVIVLLVTLIGLALILLPDIDRDLIARDTYPSTRDILSSVALTFFAYLGFSMVAFTGEDLPNPAKNLPKAMYISIVVAILTYLAISIAVFGTLPLDEVLKQGDTALAAAAEPKLGQTGYKIVAIAAMLATSSSLNANLYAAAGATSLLTEKGQFPGFFGRRLKRGWPLGVLITAVLILFFASVFDLTAIASLGSAVALAVFLMVTIGHFRRKEDTGAKGWLLILGGLTVVVTLVLFVIHMLEDEPQTFVAMIAIFVLAVVFDYLWKRRRGAGSLVPATGGAASDGS